MSSLIVVRDTTNNKNVPLQVDGSNKLSVNDSTAQSTLSTISGTLSGGLSVNDSTAQSSLSAIETSVGGTLVVSDTMAQTTLSSISSSVSGTLSTSDISAQSSLSNIESTLVGTLTVSDSTAQSSLSSIDSKLSGTLTTIQAVSRDKGGFGTQIVIEGDVSNNVDSNDYRNCMVFGNLGVAGSIIIQVSNNNTDWYDDHTSEFFSNATSYDVAGRFECITNHWRIKYKVAGTVEIRWAMKS